MHAPQTGPPPEGGAQPGGSGVSGIVPAALDGHRLVPLATALLDADGLVLHWSEDAERLLGWRAEEIVGHFAAPLLTTSQHRPEVLDLYENILAGRRWSGIFPVRHKDGHEVELDFRTYGITGPGGRPLVLATGSDVRAIQQVEANLAVLDGFFTQSPIGMAVYDTELRYVRINPALAAMNGLPVAAHLSKRIDEVLPGINTTEIEGVMREVLATGEPVIDARSHGRTPGAPGNDHAWSASYFRLADASGRVLGVSSSLIDVTERFQAEARAARAQERLTLLAEASARIGTTLDMQRTAEELVSAVVPRFADFATVDLLDPILQGRSPACSPPTRACCCARWPPARRTGRG